MKKDTVATLVTIVLSATIAVFGSGCAGAEIGGRLGIYRVDERQESSKTHDRKVGLRCLFTDCDKSQEVQGS
jgi:hypothetical protein